MSASVPLASGLFDQNNSQVHGPASTLVTSVSVPTTVRSCPVCEQPGQRVLFPVSPAQAPTALPETFPTHTPGVTRALATRVSAKGLGERATFLGASSSVYHQISKNVHAQQSDLGYYLKK